MNQTPCPIRTDLVRLLLQGRTVKAVYFMEKLVELYGRQGKGLNVLHNDIKVLENDLINNSVFAEHHCLNIENFRFISSIINLGEKNCFKYPYDDQYCQLEGREIRNTIDIDKIIKDSVNDYIKYIIWTQTVDFTMK